MNLYALVRAAIRTVNPDSTVIVRQSSGYSVDAGYNQVPDYLPPVAVQAQVQPVPETLLQHVQNVNENSLYRHMYLSGNWSALARAEGKGGDLVYWNGFEWLVEQVVEAWNPTAGWTLVRVVQQQSAPAPLLEVAP